MALVQGTSIEANTPTQKSDVKSGGDCSESHKSCKEASVYLQDLAQNRPAEYRQALKEIFRRSDNDGNNDSTLKCALGNLSIIDSTHAPHQQLSGQKSASASHPFSAADIAALGANGVDQKGHGDCVFESSVAAVAGTQKGQEQIASMITQGQNGDYIVKFPGDSNSVTVTQSDLSDPKINSSESAWGKILEAAFVKAHPDLAEGKMPGGESRTNAQLDMSILIGSTPNKLDASDKNSAPEIQKALESGNPVVAFCRDKDNGALVDGHEWTVTAYDPKTHEITVRNPWGNFHGTEKDGIQDIGNGEVKMPFSTFQKFFSEVTSPGLSNPNQQPSFWNQVADNLNPMNWF